MMEVKEIAGYTGNFSYKYRANQSNEEYESEFNRLMGASVEDIPDSQTVMGIHREDRGETPFESNTEVMTYDFIGNLVKLELFAGLNVDIKI